MIGYKSEYLEVMSFHGRSDHGELLWNCFCRCKNKVVRTSYAIKKKLHKSCKECRYKHISKHGLTKHPLYKIWSGIKQRCYNKKNKYYSVYGLKGIALDEKWSDPKKFIEWSINNGWEKSLSIDRIDSAGDYTPSNCRFISLKENGARVHQDNPGQFRGSKNLKAILSESEVKKIKMRLNNQEKQRDIALFYGLSPTTVHDIKSGKTWKHVIVSE